MSHAPLRNPHGLILFGVAYVVLAALSTYLLVSFQWSSTEYEMSSEYETLKPHPLVMITFLLGALSACGVSAMAFGGTR